MVPSKKFASWMLPLLLCAHPACADPLFGRFGGEGAAPRIDVVRAGAGRASLLFESGAYGAQDYCRLEVQAAASPVSISGIDVEDRVRLEAKSGKDGFLEISAAAAHPERKDAAPPPACSAAAWRLAPSKTPPFLRPRTDCAALSYDGAFDARGVPSRLAFRGKGSVPSGTRSFKGKALIDVDLSGAGLSGADFQGALLCGVDLTAADLRGASFDGAVLDGSTVLDRADLTGASLKDAVLLSVSADDVDLTAAALSGASSSCPGAGRPSTGCEKASFRPSSLSGADLSGASLEGFVPPARAEAKEPVLDGLRVQASDAVLSWLSSVLPAKSSVVLVPPEGRAGSPESFTGSELRRAASALDRQSSLLRPAACASARPPSGPDREVCADAWLSAADRLVRSFEEESGADPRPLQKAKAACLPEADSAACLRKAYAARISALAAASPLPLQPGTFRPDAPPPESGQDSALGARLASAKGRSEAVLELRSPDARTARLSAESSTDAGLCAAFGDRPARNALIEVASPGSSAKGGAPLTLAVKGDLALIVGGDPSAGCSPAPSPSKDAAAWPRIWRRWPDAAETR